MKTTKMTIFRNMLKTEINSVNWIRFAYGCIIFEETKLWHIFLTNGSAVNFSKSITEEK